MRHAKVAAVTIIPCEQSAATGFPPLLDCLLNCKALVLEYLFDFLRSVRQTIRSESLRRVGKPVLSELLQEKNPLLKHI